MPRLSIIMPVKNGAATLADAADSTLAALPADGELVVLNDGSDDGTADILDGISQRDARVRVLTNEVAGGVAAGLQKMLESTDSEFVGRMDADDVCLRGRFRTQLRALRTRDAVFSQVINLSSNGKLRPRPPVPIGARLFPYRLLVSNPVAHPTMLARREALTEVGGYRPVPAEDYDLWIRMALNGSRISRLPHWGLKYRIHAGQISSSADWKAKSRDDMLLDESFGDLAVRLTGRRLTRPGSLAGADGQTIDREMAGFREALQSGMGPLNAIDRRRMLGAADKITAWLHSTSTPGTSD